MMKLHEFQSKYMINWPRTGQDRRLWDANKYAIVLGWAVVSMGDDRPAYGVVFKNRHNRLVGFMNGSRYQIKNVIRFIETVKVEKDVGKKGFKRVKLIENI